MQRPLLGLNICTPAWLQTKPVFYIFLIILTFVRADGAFEATAEEVYSWACAGCWRWGRPEPFTHCWIHTALFLVPRWEEGWLKNGDSVSGQLAACSRSYEFSVSLHCAVNWMKVFLSELKCIYRTRNSHDVPSTHRVTDLASPSFLSHLLH